MTTRMIRTLDFFLLCLFIGFVGTCAIGYATHHDVRNFNRQPAVNVIAPITPATRWEI